MAFRVQFLKRLHRNLAPLKCGDSFSSGAGRGQCCNSRNARADGGAADGLLIEERIDGVRGVNDEVNAVALDQVDYIRTTFLHFVHPFYCHPGALKDVGGAGCSNQLETHIDKLTSHVSYLGFVMISDAHEDSTLFG